MGAVHKNNVADTVEGGFLEIREGLVFFKHSHDWGMHQIVIEDEWLGWMAMEVLEMNPAWMKMTSLIAWMTIKGHQGVFQSQSFRALLLLTQ